MNIEPAIIVMMEAAKSAEEDLKAAMARVKALNKEKENWRAVAKTVNSLAAAVGPGGVVSKKDIDNARDSVKNKLDSLSEMGEMESLRLQMAMDRLSKLMSTLSNLLKKMSDTATSIAQNIK